MKERSYSCSVTIFSSGCYENTKNNELKNLLKGFYYGKSVCKDMKSPSQLIDERIEELGDWRGQLLLKVRDLIRQVDPDVVEE